MAIFVPRDDRPLRLVSLEGVTIIYIYTHTRSESNIEPPTARLHAASEQMRADDSGVKYISLRYTSLRICNL